MKTNIRSLLALLFLVPMFACASDKGPDPKTAAALDASSEPAWHEGDVAPEKAATGAPVSTTVECPWLTRTKYPFLTCTRDQWGQIVLSGPVQVLETSQMPEMDPYVLSTSYIGN